MELWEERTGDTGARALGATTRYEIAGTTLTLFGPMAAIIGEYRKILYFKQSP